MKTEIISIEDALELGIVKKDDDQTLDEFIEQFFEGDPDYIMTAHYALFL